LKTFDRISAVFSFGKFQENSEFEGWFGIGQGENAAGFAV